LEETIAKFSHSLQVLCFKNLFCLERDIMFDADRKENEIVNDQPFKRRVISFIYSERAQKEKELKALQELLTDAVFNHLGPQAGAAWLNGYLAACAQITREIEK